MKPTLWILLMVLVPFARAQDAPADMAANERTTVDIEFRSSATLKAEPKLFGAEVVAKADKGVAGELIAVSTSFGQVDTAGGTGWTSLGSLIPTSDPGPFILILEDQDEEVPDGLRRLKTYWDREADARKRDEQQQAIAARREAQEELESARLADLREKGIPISIQDMVFEVDAGGGVRPTLVLKSTTAAVIERIHVFWMGFDAEGHMLEDQATSETVYTSEFAGPLADGEVGRWAFSKPLFRNAAIHCLEVNQLNVDLEGGARITLDDQLVEARSSTHIKVRGECSTVL